VKVKVKANKQTKNTSRKLWKLSQRSLFDIRKKQHNNRKKTMKKCNLMTLQNEKFFSIIKMKKNEPILIVACRLITSGDSGVSLVTSRVLRSCFARCEVSTFFSVLGAAAIATLSSSAILSLFILFGMKE
jgi:hypothetical protein